MSHDPVDVVRRLGGRSRYADLMAWTSRRRLRHAVEAGHLVRLARSVYALPSLPPALQSAARAGGVLSHVSAARHWGLPLAVEPAVVHVTVPRGSRPAREDGVQLHWATRSAERGATPVVDTVLDCATTLPFPQALAVADGALRERFVRPDALRAAAQETRGPGRAVRMRVADAADGRAENPFESVLRAVVFGLGFEPQLEIRLPGRTVHADLAHPVLKIVLEADSYAFHGGRAAFARDCRRYNELVAAGWIVLRFAWEHVMFAPDHVLDLVVAARRVAGSRRVRGAATASPEPDRSKAVRLIGEVVA